MNQIVALFFGPNDLLKPIARSARYVRINSFQGFVPPLTKTAIDIPNMVVISGPDLVPIKLREAEWCDLGKTVPNLSISIFDIPSPAGLTGVFIEFEISDMPFPPVTRICKQIFPADGNPHGLTSGNADLNPEILRGDGNPMNLTRLGLTANFVQHAVTVQNLSGTQVLKIVRGDTSNDLWSLAVNTSIRFEGSQPLFVEGTNMNFNAMIEGVWT